MFLIHFGRFNGRCDYNNIICLYIINCIYYIILLWRIIIVYGVRDVQYNNNHLVGGTKNTKCTYIPIIM